MHELAFPPAPTVIRANQINLGDTFAFTGPVSAVNLTISGTGTFTGPITCKNINGMRCVDTTNTAGWSGTDPGAWLNSAYADCPAVGCDILLATGNYTPTTAVSFSTNNKPVILHCSPNSSLTFALNTGAAVTIDTGINHKQPTGIDGCAIYNNPSALTSVNGINFPNVNGAENFVIRNSKLGSSNPLQLLTTAASVSGNVATLTFATSPIGAGYVTSGYGSVVRIGGFTGADTYFNGTFTLTGVTSTQVTYALTHANASATTNGQIIPLQFTNAINIADAGALVIFGSIQKTYVSQSVNGFNSTLTAGHSSENTKIEDSIFFQNDVGINISGQNDLNLLGTSIDDNMTTGISCGNGQLSSYGTHFENANGGVSQWVTKTNCFMNIYGGIWQDDVASGTQAQMVTASGNPGQINIYGAEVITSGRTITNILTLSNSEAASIDIFRSGANLGGDYTNSGTGIVRDLTGQTSGFQVSSAGNLIVKCQVAAGGVAAGVCGDVTASRGATSGAVQLGQDGLSSLFRSGGTTIITQSGGNQTFPTGAGTVADVLTATSAAFATATTAGTCVQNTTAVTNATTAMAVSISPVSTPGVGAVWSAFVSSAGNVTINECAVATSAGGTIAFNIRVTP